MTDPATCPYCRTAFEQPELVKIYCPGCGMPHHEDCFEENGGCTVFGCSRAPADDPKLQVSQSELNAANVYPATSVQGALYVQPQYGSMHYNSMTNPAIAVPATPPKSRTAFIVLGIFLGAFGAH